MSSIVQLDFFKTEQESEIEALRKEMADVKKSSDKVRKALFAKNGELTKCYDDIKSRLEILEKNICKG